MFSSCFLVRTKHHSRPLCKPPTIKNLLRRLSLDLPFFLSLIFFVMLINFCYGICYAPD
nr:MAG TPA: hypothetical protein [Caudoviricetes sp.]